MLIPTALPTVLPRTSTRAFINNVTRIPKTEENTFHHFNILPRRKCLPQAKQPSRHKQKLNSTDVI